MTPGRDGGKESQSQSILAMNALPGWINIFTIFIVHDEKELLRQWPIKRVPIPVHSRHDPASCNHCLNNHIIGHAEKELFDLYDGHVNHAFNVTVFLLIFF